MTKTNKMKNKDYFRLAKQSLKSRKKSTRTTVAGIAFGLILMLPVLYFTFAFLLDFNAKINKVPIVSMFNIQTTYNESKDYISDSAERYWIRGTETVDQVLDKAKHKDVIYFNNYGFQSQNMTISVNSGTEKPFTQAFPRSEDGSFSEYPNYAPAIFYALDYDKSNGKFINDSMVDYLDKQFNKSYLSQGQPFTASTKGLSELIVSNKFATKNNLKVGDTITLNYDGSYYPDSNHIIDDDFDPNNKFDFSSLENNREENYFASIIMDNFKVVGILADEYYKGMATEKDPHIFITTASISDNNGTIYAPTTNMVVYEVQSGSSTYTRNTCFTTYPTNVDQFCQEALNNGRMPLLFGISHTISYPNMSTNYGVGLTSQERILRIQFNNYSEANKASKILDSRMKALDANAYGSDYSNQLFSSYSMINMVGTIVISVFLVFGGVILFATMINLYNSIQYSVESRRNYMGMLRAVGAKNNVLNRMYFTEVILIFLKSLPWIAIFGGGICIGIKFAIDSLFSYASSFFPFTLSLSLWYIPLVFLLLFGFAFLVGIIYSRICCKPLTNRGILTLLKEDR